MKTRLLIIIGMLSTGFSGITFAEQPINCTFGDESTPLENIFEKDLAVKAFTEKHQNATRNIAANESGSLKNQLVLQTQNDNIKETLEIKFDTDTKGCYIPASYHYSYDDGIIDVTIRNSVANFTEIMNLIKSNNKSIDDFYPDDCDFVDLNVTITSGKVFGACKGTTSKFITILIDASSNGVLEVDIPIQMLYSLPSTDCKPTRDFLVISDGEETRYEIMPTDIGNLVKVEFTEGFHKIQIMGTVILPDPSPDQYCGIVEGYLDKTYLAPLDQADNGVAFEFIRCNDGFVLIQKYDESPACVKPVTKQHLIDRSWANPKSLDEIKDTPNLIKQNIIRIEDGFIALYPENICASITLDLLTEQDIQRYKNDETGLNDINILQITSSDLKEIPNIQELIYAVHSIEFPDNKYSSTYLDGTTFVEYEFFLMDKAMKKYGDSQEDYFIKLDKDYEERFTNPAKQGFSNTFEAPTIVYNDNAYSIDGTIFWASDEHEPLRMGIYAKDTIDADEKFITLTDDDIKSIPKIKNAIESIGTIKESITASKGLPEDQQNEYMEWFKQKSQDRRNADWFRLIQYDEQLYAVGFPIC